MFAKNNAYSELYKMCLSAFIEIIARINEYLRGAWTSPWRIPDDVIDRYTDEEAAFEIRQFTIKATSLVAFLNCLSTARPFSRRVNVRSLNHELQLTYHFSLII